jgi:hypothetical protein
MILDPAQSRAARGLIEWSQMKLAKTAGISISTVRDCVTRARNPLPENFAAIRLALESTGVKFIPAGKFGGAGLRFASNGSS